MTSRASKPGKAALKATPKAPSTATPKPPSKATPKAPSTATPKPPSKATPKAPSTAKPKPPSKATPKAPSKATPAQSASRLIDQRIRDLGGWRGETLARMRALIHEADPEIVEEWKWMGTPVFSHDGIVCTGESYKQVLKLTFARGASVPDPSRLFNSSLEGNTRRAIDLHEGETIDAVAFKALVRAAVAQNGSSAKKPRPAANKASR